MTSILLFHSFKELPSVLNLSADPRFGSAKVHFLFTLPNIFSASGIFIFSACSSPSHLQPHYPTPSEKPYKDLGHHLHITASIRVANV